MGANSNLAGGIGAWLRFLVLWFWLGLSSTAPAQQEFLPPQEAFKIRIELVDSLCREGCLANVNIKVAQDYYLYRERFKLQLGDQLTAADFVDLPNGKKKFDEFLNQEIEALRGDLTFAVRYDLNASGGDQVANLVSQGCADAGLCYPPMETPLFEAQTGKGVLSSFISAGKNLSGLLPRNGAESARSSGPLVYAPQVGMTSSDGGVNGDGLDDASRVGLDEAGGLAGRLASESVWVVLPIFFGLGLLLAFTPCTLPMLPIVTSLVVGQGGKGGLKPVALSLTYVIGMASTYSLLGVLAGLSGQSLVMALQQRPVLWSFGGLLALLGLLLLKGVSLQVPAGVQNWLQDKTGKLKGGQFIPVLLMGVLSALLIGPCVAPPLAGALLYIGQTGDALVGGAALFLLALGMGLPIVLFAAGAGRLLPKAGAWMNAVSSGFGFILLGTALWLIGPVTPLPVMFGLWTIWLAAVAVSLHALAQSEVIKSVVNQIVFKTMSLILGMVSAVYLIGFLTDAPSLITPLYKLTDRAVESHQGTSLLKFEHVASSEVKSLLAQSKTPVVLDFYADWCVACKEFEVLTFPDARVQSGLAGFTLLKVDVTDNLKADQELLKGFQLFGPPAILFFAPGGGELSEKRVVGFQSADRFVSTLDAVRDALVMGR